MPSRNIIIYVGGFELPDKNAAAQRVLANAKIFRDLGYQVVLIGVDKNLSSDVKVLKTKSSVQGFETWRLPYPKTKGEWVKQLSSIAAVQQVAAHYGEQYIYATVAYNYPALALFKLNRYASGIQALSIADTTEWYDSSGGGLLFKVIKWLDTSFRMRIVQTQVSGIITPSYYLTEFYKKRACHVIELPTLYDVSEMLDKETGTIRNEDEDMRFLYAGSAFNIERVNKQKSNIKDRLDKVISMFAQVAQANDKFILNIYGLTKDNYLTVFGEHREVLEHLHDKIVFHGRKPHQEILRNIRESDFTVFIRDIDRVVEAGFPSKFSESLTCGTPVFCNMISNIQKYALDNKNCIILDKDEIDSQVKTVLAVLGEGKDKVKEMKSYCRAHPVFDYKNFIQPTKVFLHTLESK